MKVNLINEPNEELPFFFCDTTLHFVKIENEKDLETFKAMLSPDNHRFPAPSGIGKIHIIEEHAGMYYIGTPEELKKNYCDVIDYWTDETY